MSAITSSDAAKAVVRRNTEDVQSRGNFDVFEELFAADFIDHTTQPSMTPDKAGVRKLYGYLREAFPDFHAVIWQLADGDRVTTYKARRLLALDRRCLAINRSQLQSDRLKSNTVSAMSQTCRKSSLGLFVNVTN